MRTTMAWAAFDSDGRILARADGSLEVFRSVRDAAAGHGLIECVRVVPVKPRGRRTRRMRQRLAQRRAEIEIREALRQ